MSFFEFSCLSVLDKQLCAWNILGSKSRQKINWTAVLCRSIYCREWLLYLELAVFDAVSKA